MFICWNYTEHYQEKASIAFEHSSKGTQPTGMPLVFLFPRTNLSKMEDFIMGGIQAKTGSRKGFKKNHVSWTR